MPSMGSGMSGMLGYGYGNASRVGPAYYGAHTQNVGLGSTVVRGTNGSHTIYDATGNNTTNPLAGTATGPVAGPISTSNAGRPGRAPPTTNQSVSTQPRSAFSKLNERVLAAEQAATKAANTYGKNSSQHLSLEATAGALRKKLQLWVGKQAARLHPGTFRTEGTHYGAFDVVIKPSATQVGAFSLEIPRHQALFDVTQRTADSFTGELRSGKYIDSATVRVTRKNGEEAKWLVDYTLRASQGAIAELHASGYIDFMSAIKK